MCSSRLRQLSCKGNRSNSRSRETGMRKHSQSDTTSARGEVMSVTVLAPSCSYLLRFRSRAQPTDVPVRKTCMRANCDPQNIGVTDRQISRAPNDINTKEGEKNQKPVPAWQILRSCLLVRNHFAASIEKLTIDACCNYFLTQKDDSHGSEPNSPESMTTNLMHRAIVHPRMFTLEI